MLEDEEFEQIAANLCGTTKNVYSMAKAMYNYDWKDSDFAKLKDELRVWRCIECSEWKDVDDMEHESEFCKRCVGQDLY